jgi:hypothetical protein
MVAPWCTLSNMRKSNFQNFYGSLAEYKEDEALDADARRKTAEGIKYVMEEQVEAMRKRAAMDPFTSFEPQVEKRLAENAAFLYEQRNALTDPKSVKVTGKKKKKK